MLPDQSQPQKETDLGFRRLAGTLEGQGEWVEFLMMSLIHLYDTIRISIAVGKISNNVRHVMMAGVAWRGDLTKAPIHLTLIDLSRSCT